MAMLKKGDKYPIDVISSFDYTCPECGFQCEFEKDAKKKICPECKAKMVIASSHSEAKDKKTLTCDTCGTEFICRRDEHQMPCKDFHLWRPIPDPS